ncbi:MAG: hypothetical protein COB04_08870 [Gammaproteobacteria bacterium]|nr:MAG: hypothetical protein COB04_08870 [Gammaproteobacteria bacterium]
MTNSQSIKSDLLEDLDHSQAGDTCAGSIPTHASLLDTLSRDVMSSDGELCGEDALVSNTVSPGTMLREAREALGWSIGDVAERLYLTRSKVTSLEHDDFRRPSEVTFIRGYMRSYANLVGLSGDDVAQAFNQLHLSNGKSSLNPQYLGGMSTDVDGVLVGVSVKHQAHWGDAKVRWFTYGVGLMLVLMVIFNWEQIEYNGFMDIGFERIAVERVDGSLIVENLSDLNSSLPPLHLLQGGLSDLLDQNLPPSQAEAEAQNYPEELPQYERLVEGQGIFMSFSGECWVSVKDHEDQVIFASIKNAGETLDISGIGPFKVLLGNAPVVELKYNGRAVNLRPFTRKKTHTAVVRLHS